MDVSSADVRDPKHPVLASVLMGILRALDDESTGKSSSSSTSDDNAVCRIHDNREPPCRRRKHGKSSEVEVQEYVTPPDEEMLSPKEDIPTLDLIQGPSESPKLHTILETEEEGEEEGDKQEGSREIDSSEEKKMQTRERDAIKHLQKEEIKARSSTSSPLVTSDDSDVAAFLSKHEYATLFGPKSGHFDKILIPTRFVQDYGETSSSVKTGDKSPLKRGSDEELERTQIKKQKSDDTNFGSPIKTSKRKLESSSTDRETSGQVTEFSSYVKDETDSSMGTSVVDSSSQRKRLKTSEEESEFSSGETLSSDIMSDDTVEESTASSILDDRQVKTPGKRKKRLTKTLKSLRIEPPDIDGMSDFSSDGQTGILKPSMTRNMPAPKVGLGNYGWTSGARKDAKSILQQALSTSLEDFSDVLSPEHQSSTAHSVSRGKADASDTIGSGSVRQVSESEATRVEDVSNIAVTGSSELLIDPSARSSHTTSDSKLTSSDFQSLSSSVSTEKSQNSSPQSEKTTDITDENVYQEYISSTIETQSAVEDLGQMETSYVSGTTMSSEIGSVLTSSEKLDAKSAQPSKTQSELLQGSIVSSKLTSATFEEDVTSPPTLTSISQVSEDSTSSDTAELSENVEVSSSDVLTLSSSLSTTSKSGTSSSKQPGIEPRDLPAVLRTGTQQPLVNHLNDFSSSLMSAGVSNTSSNASTDMQQSGITTGDTFEPSPDVYSTSIGEEQPITDFVDDVTVPLSNINLTDALLRSDPSVSDFEDSDTLTSSSDEYVTHRQAFDMYNLGFPHTSSAKEHEATDIAPYEVHIEDSVEEPIEDKSNMVIDEKEVKEVSLIKTISELEDEKVEVTSALQQPFSVTSYSKSSTSNKSKPSSDEDKDRLLMIDLDKNDKVFEDILITNDTSVSSLASEYLHTNEQESLSLTPSEYESTYIKSATKIDDFALIYFARDIVHFVTLNAVATVITEIVVNVAVTRLRVELDFSLQMEKALFPGTEAEDTDNLIHMRWIAPARYKHGAYAESQSAKDKGFVGYELEWPCKNADTEEEGEAFLLCLERAFFPCLTEGDDRSNRRLSSPPESTHHSVRGRSLKANTYQMDKKTKPCNAYQLVTMASRVSTVAVGTIFHMLSIMTSFSCTIWNYISDNFGVSKVKRKDEGTQYEDFASPWSQGEVVTGISDEECSPVPESSTGFPQMSGWVKRDEVSLHILASKIVASAVTGAVCGKEYAVSPASLELSLQKKSLTKLSDGIEVANEPDDSTLQLASSVDYRLGLSASTVVGEVDANAPVIHDSIRESPSATPTDLSTQSENMLLSSERDRKLDEDDTSACSLSDIPLSSITFMRQQLVDMREIFQTTFSRTKGDITSTPPVALITTSDAQLSTSQPVLSFDPLEVTDEIIAVAELASSTAEEQVVETAAAEERIIQVNMHSNVDIEKNRTQSFKLDKALKTSSIDSEHVVEHSGPSSDKEVKSFNKIVEYESNTFDLAQECRKVVTAILEATTEIKNESDVALTDLPKFEQQGEEIVNPSDSRESDSNSTSSSALSLSDIPFSGISYIREQLANVKTIANSIMDDFNSYAEERTLVAKRSSQLTCSAASVRSHSSCDSARTIENNSSESSRCLNLHRESKLGESKKSSPNKGNSQVPEDTPDVIVHQTYKKGLALKQKVFSQTNGSLERPNDNCNAKTQRNEPSAQVNAKNKGEFEQLNNEYIHETGHENETSERKAGLEAGREYQVTKGTVLKSRHASDQDDRNRTVQMTETQQTRQIAAFSRSSPSRRHVIPRKKDTDNPHGSYSEESTCSTDYSSSIVSRPSSSCSDGTVSSRSKRVTVESESQGKGRTDVSCRISDRGILVNTAFVNAIDEDHHSSPVNIAANEKSDGLCVKNKLKINVKVSPRSRKKHHSHRVRSGVRDKHLQLASEDKQNARAILDNEMLVKKSQEVKVDKISMHTHTDYKHSYEKKSFKTEAEGSRIAETQAHDEVIEANCRKQADSSSFKHELSDGPKHRAVQLLNQLLPEKKSSSESQCSEESKKAVGVSCWETDQKCTMRECLSDGAVSEKHQFLGRAQPSLKRKTRETKPQDSPCPFCAEKSDHPDDLLAAPVISRSERTRAVLSMLDDVADNLALDSSVHDTGKAHTMGRIGSFRKLFHSRKNKRRSGDKTPAQSPRVLSDSSMTTESDGDSGSPECSSDSSHTPRSSSAASLLNNVLRNLSAKINKKKSKRAPSGTPRGRKAKEGSVSAFDEMLDDLDDDFFIDDAFPSLVSVRDSASEDNTSLNEVLKDLVEEWSFEGLQEALDSSPQSIGDRIREKLKLFMAEVRKEKRKAELLFGRASTL